MISAIQLTWTIGSAFVVLLVAGTVAYVNMQNALAKAKGDLNALGKKYGRLTSMLSTSAWADSKEKQDALARATEPQW